ncbi:MAG: hypothetical protein JNK25_07745 [Phycisphaerae bacterium]|nr:hypothetical protein [Phycisphaerae bacterium]
MPREPKNPSRRDQSRRTPPRARRAPLVIPAAPATPDELHEFLRERLKITCPRSPMLEGHAAPFEYLCHSFFESATPRDLVLWANRGGGKTFLGAVATLLDLVFKPGIDIRILGGSADQSRRMLEHLRALFDPATDPHLAAMVEGGMTGRRIRLVNGSTVEILSQSHTSVRGTRVQILRCDEADLFKKDVWRAAQFVTRSKRCGPFMVAGRVECLSTMHRPHGIMHDIVAECATGSRRLFKWGVLDVLETCGPAHRCTAPDGPDCPLLPECAGRAKATTPPGGHFIIADAIGQKRRSSLGDWQAEMLCLRPRRSGAVLEDFDPARHVGRWRFSAGSLRTDLGGFIPCASFLCGMDFGIRGDGVILWASLAESGDLYILDECIRPGLTIHQQADLIIAGNPGEGHEPWPLPQWIGCDPSGANQDHHGRSCVTTLRERGLATAHSRGGLQEGLEFIRARLRPADGSPPRLFIHERCHKLIEAMTRYHYPEDKPQSLIPVKDGHDHPVDALRYLVRCLETRGAAKAGVYAR